MYDESLSASSINTSQLPSAGDSGGSVANGKINKTDLPTTAVLASRKGKREGEVLIVKNEVTGNVEAYQWSVAAGDWQNLGQVVDEGSSSDKKIHFEGKEYDFVFDVDVAEGAPPLKLPYNVGRESRSVPREPLCRFMLSCRENTTVPSPNPTAHPSADAIVLTGLIFITVCRSPSFLQQTENPYEAAQNFLNKHELPQSYIDQVVQFIEKNSGGASLGAAGDAFVDPYTGASSYRAGGGSNSTNNNTAGPNAATSSTFGGDPWSAASAAPRSSTSLLPHVSRSPQRRLRQYRADGKKEPD